MWPSFGIVFIFWIVLITFFVCFLNKFFTKFALVFQKIRNQSTELLRVRVLYRPWGDATLNNKDTKK